MRQIGALMLVGVAIVITAPFGPPKVRKPSRLRIRRRRPKGSGSSATFIGWAASGEIANDGVQLIGNSRHPKVIEARPGPNRESKVIKNWKPNSDD